MGLGTTWEQLYRAGVTLATADAPLKERLASVFHSHLLDLTPKDSWLKNRLLGGS
jgi:hypothetical protein